MAMRGHHVVLLTVLYWLISGTNLPFLGSVPAISAFQLLLLSSVSFVAVVKPYTFYLAYKTLPRDLKAGYRLLLVKLFISSAKKIDHNVAEMFERNVATFPDKVALIFEGRKWTFKMLSEYSNKIARLLIAKNIKKGDCVALVMTNRPEYVATWLGASKIGAVTALINYNLRHKALFHCIAIVKANLIVCGSELQSSIKEIMPLFSQNPPILVSGVSKSDIQLPDAISVDDELTKIDSSTVEQTKYVHFEDKLLYIYTSGTTGLPKAAIITNARYMFFSSSVHHLTDMKDDDVIYNPLPLYHTAGGMVGMGQVLLFGVTAVIRSKFSVSQFWPECSVYGCTVAQYVGEICRYLLNTNPRPSDKAHKVRVMFGNGVRPEIWKEFTERFNMPKIAEFYGATESNANIMNFEGKVGACGFLPVVFPDVYPVKLIKVDENTGEPIRGPDGLCLICKPGEPGEFVGKIKSDDPLREFSGYADSSATSKKIMRDVFSKGDYAFVSGDILVSDEFGYIYFKDRLGDTFRWRGENVSTTEVEGQVSLAAKNADCVIFGVEVTGCEGKAGMAVIVQSPEMTRLDINGHFLKELTTNLPPYAMPLFLRLVTSIDTTGTFKLKKLELQKEGYTLPGLLSDSTDDEGHSLYFLQQKPLQYIPLTKTLLNKISKGDMGL